MRLASTLTRLCGAVPCLLTGCFSQAPTVDTATSSATGSTAATAEGGSDSSDGGTTVSPDSTGVDATGPSSTSSPGESTDADTTGSDSTGGVVDDCLCPEMNAFCDGFEARPGPWSLPAGGGGIESWTDGGAPCGATSMRTSVGTDMGQSYSVALAQTMAHTGDAVATPMTAHTWIRISPECGDQADLVRIFEFRLPDGAGGQWYAWRVVMSGAQLALASANHMGPQGLFTSDAPPLDTWFELRLHTDFTNLVTPTSTLEVDGMLVLDIASGTPSLSATAATTNAPTEIILGAFQEQATFSSPCTVDYDHVWLSPG